MPYFIDQQEYQSYLYRKDLKREAVKLGALLLLIFVVQEVLVFAAVAIIKATGTADLYTRSTSMQLLFSGAISALVFFLLSAVYCLIRRMPFGRLFPFEGMRGRMLVMLCVAGLCFSLMSNYAASLVTDVFSLFGMSNRGGDIIENGVQPSVFLYYLTVAALPALAEEFAFRGVILGSLRKYSDALAILISAGTFALMHGNFVQMPFTFCCGLVFGFLTVRTNSLLPAIIIHFLNNALSVTYDVLTAYHILSYAAANILYNLVIIILCVLSAFVMRRLIAEKPDLFRFENSDRVIPFRRKLSAVLVSPTLIIFAAIMMLSSFGVLIGIS